LFKQKEFDSNHRFVFFPPPKVVILPGPHKTGSTSLQTCLVDWTWNWLSRSIREGSDRPVSPPLALPKWAWAVPDETVLRKMKLMHVYPTKAFASLMGVADLDPTMGLSPQGRTQIGGVITEEDVKKVIELYRSSMEQEWRENYKIIYGSEEMDRLVNPSHSNSSDLMDAILNILPWNVSGTSRTLEEDDVEVVLVHRTPRVKHLISVWHQMRMRNETFRNYLLKRVLPHARFVDGLGVAQQFLGRNIRTTILDMNGMQETYGNRTNICHIVACDILQTEECTEDTHRLKFLVSNPSLDKSDVPQNIIADEGAMDLTAKEVDAINSIMIEYDCGYRDSLVGFHEGGMLRYMYSDDVFYNCPHLGNDPKLPQRSLRWLVDQIQGVVGLGR
jgi:hypothetical protein